MMPAIWFAVALSLAILTSTSAQDISLTFVEGGGIPVGSMDNVFGNDVIRRNAAFSNIFNRGWLDNEHSLRAGLLTKYFFYLHDTYKTYTISPQVIPQIWRPTVIGNTTYELVWQQKISIERNRTSGTLCTLYLGEGDRFEIMTGDRIGIATVNDGFGPLSSDDLEGHETYPTNGLETPSFVVGHVYRFDDMPDAIIISIAVEIVPFETTTKVPTTNDDRGLVIGISVLAGIVILTLIFGIIYFSKRTARRQTVEEDGPLAMTQAQHTIPHRPVVTNGARNVSAVSDRVPYESTHGSTDYEHAYNEIIHTNEDNADPNSVYDEIATSGGDFSQSVQVRAQTIPKTLHDEPNTANNDPVYDHDDGIDLVSHVNADQYHAQTLPKVL